MVTLALAEEYRAGFSITGPDPMGREMLRRVEEQTRAWFERLPSDAGGVEPAVESGEIEELGYRRFQIDLLHGNAPNFQLHLDVKLATTGGPVVVSIQSDFHETVLEAPPPHLLAGPPSLIRELFQAFDCYNGADRLSAQPTLVAPETAEEFAANRILNPQRQLPIVAVSQDWQEQVPISPSWLQGVLAGQAEVATYDGDTAEELKRHIGFQLACFNGAMRIYQPGCSRGDPRTRHHFWMPTQARAVSSQPARLRVQAFTCHLPEPDLSPDFDDVRRQVRQKEAVERAAEIIARPLRQQVRNLEREIESLRQQSQERETQSATGMAELHDLHQQLLQQDLALESIREQLEQAAHQEAEHEPEIARLHQQQVERDQRIEALRQQLESAISQAGAGESEVAQLHIQLLERDNSVEALRQQIDEAAHKEAEVEQFMARLHAQIQASDGLVESLRQQLEDAAKERGARSQEVEQLQASLQERDGELTELRPQLEEARKWIEESRKLVEELTRGLNSRDADIAKLILLLEGVDDGSASPDQIVSELSRELQEREEELRAISAHLEEARNRADDAENMAAELRRELEQRSSELIAIGNLTQETTNNVADANGTIPGLHEQIKTLNDLLTEADLKEANDTITVDDLTKKLRERDATIRSLNYHLPRASQALGPDEPYYYEELPEFNSVYGAIEYAAQRLDRLRFLPSAYATANGYPFQRPDNVYYAFSLLQDLAVVRSNGDLGIRIEDWMKERKCDYALHESQTTMQQHGDARRFKDGSKYVEMQEHIKIGSGTSDKQHYIRIHIAWNEVEKSFLIGHVGEHLPIASN